MKSTAATLRGLAARENKSNDQTSGQILGQISGEAGHGGKAGSLGRATVHGKTELMSQASHSEPDQPNSPQAKLLQGRRLQERLTLRQSRLHISEIVEQEPASEFDSVGLELQAHRARKGHDLEMAARVLRIKIAHLKAIEDGQFDVLPGRTYAVGFVRAYAEYLGLDPEDCVRRFKLEYAVATEVEGEGEAQNKKIGMVFPDLREEVQLPHGSIIILAGLLVLGVWGGWYLSTSDERAFSSAETEVSSVAADELPARQEAQVFCKAQRVKPLQSKQLLRSKPLPMKQTVLFRPKRTQKR